MKTIRDAGHFSAQYILLSVLHPLPHTFEWGDWYWMLSDSKGNGQLHLLASMSDPLLGTEIDVDTKLEPLDVVWLPTLDQLYEILAGLLIGSTHTTIMTSVWTNQHTFNLGPRPAAYYTVLETLCDGSPRYLTPSVASDDEGAFFGY